MHIALQAHAPPAEAADPAAWTGAELAGRDDWQHVFTEAERQALCEWGRALEAQGEGVEDLAARTPQQLRPDPVLRRLMDTVRAELRDGRGFVLMRGFPLDALSAQAARLAYVALGRLLGLPMPQNRQGELLHDVRDTGADPRDLNVRLSRTRAEQDFHTDGADLIGLLCLRGARAGGLSRIVSSVSVYQRVAAARPDLAPLLFQPWAFHLKGEHAPGAAPYVRLPIVQRVGPRLSTFFIGWYIRDAPSLPGVPPLEPRQLELLALYEATANDPALYLDMAFQRGDIQWLKNSVILHKRTAYEDWDEPERKRHLWRLWLAAPDFPDGIVALRSGHEAAARAG